jgi:asparagine synthase (glutamine-hydrolysing)
MCGIAGIIDTTSSPERTLLERMCRIMTHRGPDGEGYYIDGPAGLGHRRLSIIDLESGKQPMSNEDGAVWITYNGEIYNFPELRKELIGKGHRFKTRSDTETIVHAYEEYGIKCLQKLRGMFAFALWDCRKKLLFIARDRIGKKPLYYCAKDSKFIFASELKAILQDKRIQRTLNPEALVDYLTYHYIPFPKTIFEGIYKLPPGHYMTVNILQKGHINVNSINRIGNQLSNENRHSRICGNDSEKHIADVQAVPQTESFDISIHQYWDIEYEPDYSLTEDDWAEALREKLKEAVRMRLISDVPLGAFLSGGIDSSTVVALMSMVQSEPVN